LQADRQLKALPGDLEGLVYFVTQIAPWLFPDDVKEEAFFHGLKSQFEVIIRHSDAINTYCTEHPTLRGLIHPNPEVDNAFFWQDEDGNYECGLFDWGGTGYQPYTRLFHGCIRSALPEVYLEHEEKWFQFFSDEVREFGGPCIEAKDCLQISRLMFAIGVPNAPKGFMGSLGSISPDEWKTITDKRDARIMGRWNVRTGVLSALTNLIIWRRGPHWTYFLDFCKSNGYRTEPPFE